MGARTVHAVHGIVLCFDEVITGFRVALNSAQGLFGVTPDIAIFGKAMAGGLPLAAVAGKKEIMDLLVTRRVVAGGTFGRYPLGMAGVPASIRLLEKDNSAFYRHVDHLQKRLMDGLKEIRNRWGDSALHAGRAGYFDYSFYAERQSSGVHRAGFRWRGRPKRATVGGDDGGGGAYS